MVRIHALRTGSVRIRPSQRERRRGGPIRVLLDREWTEWLPIHAWAVEHPEGIIVVDTGESARVAEPGYFPRWHPYYRLALEFDVAPEQEIGPQLRALGITEADVRSVILTHFHTDHVGGLDHFPRSRVLVSAAEHAAASGVLGRVQGYLPEHWPAWFAPQALAFVPEAVGPFAEHCAVTTAGDVVVVPTPGHTPHHVSVIVRTPGLSYFLAGDTSYSEALLRIGEPDGVTTQPGVMTDTLARIRAFGAAERTVYLPTHDADCERRLLDRQVLEPARASNG